MHLLPMKTIRPGIIIAVHLVLLAGFIGYSAQLIGGTEEPQEPLFKGLGAVHHAVTTASPIAQQYFDQGLALTYAFNHDEAERSFQQAARLGPNMAMAYWGIALVLGPNYNDPGDAQRGRRAYEAIGKARALEKNVSQRERDLIDALAKRYGSDGASTSERAAAYADAMRSVAHRYPDDPDIQTFFAESLMELRPWQLWSNDGKPAPKTGEIVATLEAVLKKNPEHIGANHFYIHAVEASSDPGHALASADRLGRLAPGAGHLVHMPSHIYLRVGRYHDASLANMKAIEVDRTFIKQTGETGVYPTMYYSHNLQFLCYSLMMEGRGKEALASARQLAAVVSPDMIREMPDAEITQPVVYYVMVRFEDWNAVLKEPAPSARLKFTDAIWHYARGSAFSATGGSKQARHELEQLDAIAAALPPDRANGMSSNKSLLKIASLVLAARIAAAEGDDRKSIADLTGAVRRQDALPYNEPPDWYYPVRESLGEELLKAGKPADAEKVYRGDLARTPDNPRSLRGLSIALRAEGECSTGRPGGGALHQDVGLRRRDPLILKSRADLPS
jgi:tetratricopeptide (TPR) repeat protein